MKINRRLTITALANGEFRSETDYQTTLGFWNNLSTTVTGRFPWIIVQRVAGRDDFQILVRAQEAK